ncbi:hypothetical protein CcCBS67573_g01770 [Chytriomyces confervae]|uniref:Disease resistance R13L4/SHOC-2-like LRR domain-containing protein n=1 Tax=Chytriomyces confervae TaxID=246404 RepID=A0A507FMU4_9FUNG|nr:hypothetical protein CcCBS67573_g01770 [Chytriomyces confervae]
MAHTLSPLQTRMPPEILQDIFSWIEPCAAPKYTRLCSIINRSIKTRHFLRLNLDKFRIQSPLDADTNLESRTEFKAKPWKKIRENSRNLWTKLSYYEQVHCLTQLSPDILSAWLCWDDPNHASWLLPWDTHLQPFLHNHRFCSNCKSCQGFGCHVCLTPFERVWISWPNPLQQIYCSFLMERLVSFNCMTVVRTQWTLTSLAHMKRLETLCVRGSYARLPTNLVEEVGSLTKLEDLDLSWNDLTGSLPTGLYNLTTLTSINLERNQISGTLPNSISNLANLKQLRLANNAFSGSLPHTIGKLHALILLDLHSNMFDGDIPESLGSCAALQKLDLGCNRFSGAIPTSFGDLKDLQVLSLTRNQLSGRIPSELGNLQNLNVLALGGNKFDVTDCIPKELEQLDELRELHLWWEDGSEGKPGFLDQFSPDSNIFRLLQAFSGDTEEILDGEGDVSDQDNGGFDLSDEDEDADDFDYAGLGEGFMVHDGKKYKHLGEHKSDDSDASDESDDAKVRKRRKKK